MEIKIRQRAKGEMAFACFLYCILLKWNRNPMEKGNFLCSADIQSEKNHRNCTLYDALNSIMSKFCCFLGPV